MSFTHTVNSVYAVGTRTITQSVSKSASAQLSIDEEIVDSSSDLEIAMVLDVSEIAMILILSDQDITLETNSGAAPDNTLSLKAGEPYIWHADSLFTNKLTVDITAIFITNDSGAAARLQIEVLYDATP